MKTSRSPGDSPTAAVAVSGRLQDYRLLNTRRAGRGAASVPPHRLRFVGRTKPSGTQLATAKKGSTGRKRGARSGSRVRDAITGRFVRTGTEKRRPKTTIVERITGRRRGKKR